MTPWMSRTVTSFARFLMMFMRRSLSCPSEGSRAPPATTGRPLTIRAGRPSTRSARIAVKCSQTPRSRLPIVAPANLMRDERDEPEDDRRGERPAERLDPEPRHQPGRQLQHDGVEDDQKEAESDDRHRQR